jgi:hypothetical protein
LDATSDQFDKLREVVVAQDSKLEGATGDAQSEWGEDLF